MKEECKHYTTTEKWVEFDWYEDDEDMMPSGEWETVDTSTFKDVDLHRYRCTQCGTMKYYSEAARNFFENGIKSNIQGLE